MSESASSPDEPRGENRLFGKHKWRRKLFSADSRFGRAPENLESTDDNIVDFLNTARPKAGPQSAPFASCIDVAAGSRHPTALDDPDDSVVDVYRRPKPRQNKGLRVRFESDPPEYIGFGGDEAELPSKDVFRSFTDSSERPPSQEPPHYNTNDQRSQAYGPSTNPYDETSFRLSPLKRRPTGIDGEFLTEESHHAGHDQEAIRSAFSASRTMSPRPPNEEQDLDLDLPDNDVGKLTLSSSPASDDLSYDKNYTWQAAETTSHGPTRHFVAPPPKSLPTNSLITREPPEPPYASQEASSASYSFTPATKSLPNLPDSGHQRVRQDSQNVSISQKNKPLALPTVSKSVGDESLDDFDSRVRRFRDLFRLNASAYVDIMAVSVERWVMVSAWWFLRGRGQLESTIRGKSRATAPDNAASDSGVPVVSQAYVNLAKAWWVLKDVTPNLPEMKRLGNASMISTVAVLRNLGDQHLAELVDVHLSILENFRVLTVSMKKNDMLPPDDLQMQGLDSKIFLKTPILPPDIAALMINNFVTSPIKGRNHVANPFFPILVGDTERHFTFSKMFVDVFWDSLDDAKSGIQCVVSVLRERTDWAVKATIASQDKKVNLVIQSGEHGGLHWHDVQWRIPLHTMQLGLAEGIYLQVKFSEKDFKTIWGICDYTQRVRKEYSARSDEEIVHECELPIFECIDSPSFPAEPMKDCRVRLFERKVSGIEGNSQYRAHDGYRLVVITPPSSKTMSKVNHQLGRDSPILFGTHRSKGGNTMTVRVPSSLMVFLTFHEESHASLFRSTLAGTLITKDDHCSASLQLYGFAISSISADQDLVYENASRCVSDLRFHKLLVVNRGPPTYGHDSQSIVRSGSPRMLTECDSGTFVDRISSGLGELQLNLSVENLNEIRLLRAAQQDMTWSFADGLLQEADISSLSHMLHTMGTSPSIRTYHFRCLSDLHSFQAMLTGFHVAYDGLASTFSISRGRMHKRWEASTPRLQIIKQDRNVQLVAFFKDFIHGACMNFVLKVTDCFDTFARSGVCFLRIVDAKFALPKGESDPARAFVCLDMPEYPGEHDDIIIGFDNEQGEHSKRLNGSDVKSSWTDQAADRDRFAETLPAPVNKMSRMASLRR